METRSRRRFVIVKEVPDETPDLAGPYNGYEQPARVRSQPATCYSAPGRPEWENELSFCAPIWIKIVFFVALLIVASVAVKISLSLLVNYLIEHSYIAINRSTTFFYFSDSSSGVSRPCGQDGCSMHLRQ